MDESAHADQTAPEGKTRRDATRDIVQILVDGRASGGLVRSGRIDRSFYEFALLEHGSGPNEGGQVRRADEAVAEWDGPAQRIWLAAAEPDWRVRLLERLGSIAALRNYQNCPSKSMRDEVRSCRMSSSLWLRRAR
jgi:hypothetical protein